MNVYFGVKWDVPAFEDATEVSTPVGELCLHCLEPVTAGESGTLMGSIEMDHTTNPPTPVNRVRPAHIECFLRSMLGSVAHMEGRCTCHGGTVDDMDPRSYRVQARELMEWLVLHGR